MDSEFSRIMNSLGMTGGDNEPATDSDSPSQLSEQRERRSLRDAPFALSVKCLEVTQKKKDDGLKIDYHAKVCKDPPIHMRFFDKEVKYALLVKGAIRYLNDRLRMKDVKEATIVVGKKKTKLSGDKLGDMVDIEALGEVDEIHVKLQ